MKVKCTDLLGEYATPWERLVAAIIFIAVKDYQEAFVTAAQAKPNSEKRNKAYCDMYLIEKFFLSRWCAALTNDNGEKLLDLTKKSCKRQV